MFLKQNSIIFIGFLLSILLHYILLFLSWNTKTEHLPTPRAKSVLKVKQKNFKTLGVKESKKKDFSPQRKKEKDQLDWSHFRAQKPTNSAPLSEITPQEEIIQRQKAKRKFRMTLSKRIRQQKKTIERLAQNSTNKELLQNKSFNMNIEPPKGVSIDELNSLEKIYYSFNKRVFESYVRSFLTTYHGLKTTKPYIENDMKNVRHRLTAKVTYDELGNIQSIKIIKSSVSDNVHELFENSLKNMRSVPNPPKSLINSSGTFSIFYNLNVN